MKKFKGYVNRTICGTAGVGILVFGSMIDSKSYLPAILCGVCAVVFLLYGIANGWIE
jgi:hypothetical protein